MTGLKSLALLLDSAPRTWTSQEEIHLRLCRALKNIGVQPVLVYAQELAPELSERLRAAGAAIEVISYARGPLHYRRELGKLISLYQIGMVHVCFFDYFSLIPWLARSQGIETIIFEELNSGMMQARSWKRRLLRMRTYLTSLPMTRVIAISDFVKRELVNRGMKADQVFVRYLGVDTSRFVPDPMSRVKWAEKYSIRPDELILSTVTVLRTFKNPDTILRSCALLANRNVSFRLFIAGDGAMMAELKDLSRSLGIEHHVEWLGYCPDPVSLLQASDIFILASVGEAFGLVVPEAMACGVPVIGSRSGAIPEIIEDGKTGILANPRDESSFANALEKLSRDSEFRVQMGRNSLSHVHEKFTVDLDVANTLRIYESLWQG